MEGILENVLQNGAQYFSDFVSGSNEPESQNKLLFEPDEMEVDGNYNLMDNSEYNEEGRLFLIFNTSQTISTAQAAAIILGLTALLGGLAALAYFFMLSMGGGTGSGYGSGYGSGGGGGYSSGSGGYGSGGGHHGAKRSASEVDFSLFRVLALINDMDKILEEENGSTFSKKTSLGCKKLSICQMATATLENDTPLLRRLIENLDLGGEMLQFVNESDSALWSEEMGYLEDIVEAGDFGRRRGNCLEAYKDYCRD